MKEMVDRILAGSVVDIAKDGGDYYLNVLKDGNKYKIGFMSSLHNKEYGSRLTVEMIKEAGERLIALSDELNARKKFKNGDKYFTVRPNGKIIDWYFDSSESGDMARLYMGNLFTTLKEAEENKGAVMAKYQELRDKGLV